MNKRLWVLNPLLLSLTLPAIAAEEENLIVSANRSQRTVAEMAQTTGLLKEARLNNRFRGKEFKDVLAQLIPESMSVAGAYKLRHEHAWSRHCRAH